MTVHCMTVSCCPYVFRLIIHLPSLDQLDDNSPSREGSSNQLNATSPPPALPTTIHDPPVPDTQPVSTSSITTNRTPLSPLSMNNVLETTAVHAK